MADGGPWRRKRSNWPRVAESARSCFARPTSSLSPGHDGLAARQTIDQACQQGLRIERLSLDEVCELHAARELYSNALQGNVDFAPAEVLAWLKVRFRPWFEKYSRRPTDRPLSCRPNLLDRRNRRGANRQRPILPNRRRPQRPHGFRKSSSGELWTT